MFGSVFSSSYRRPARLHAALLLALVGSGCTSGADPSNEADATSPSAPDSSANDAGNEPEGPPMPLEVLVQGEEQPWALAIDDRYVYWTAARALRRAPLAGGAATTLAEGQGLRRVVVAAGYVYFSDGPAGTVSRVAREGGSVEPLGTGVFTDGVAVHGERVYWASHGMTVGSESDGSLGTAALDGTDARILVGGLSQPSAVAVDDAFVYFTSTAQTCSAGSGMISGCFGAGVSKVPLGGGAAVVVDGEGAPLDLALGELGIYWMATPGPRVMFAPRDGSAAQMLARVVGESPGPLAVDADALYFSSSADGRVMKLALDGGAPQPLVTDLGTTGGIAVDDDWVYVAATRDGRILRVAKDGSASEPAGPITGPCPMPIGTAAEVAATPRADTNLELLALHLDAGKVAATQETYDRVVADVAAIRRLAPELADIGYFPPHDGKQLGLVPNDLTARSIEAGDYSAWDCLNDFYGVESLEVIPNIFGPSLVLITLKGIYDLDRVAEAYRMLPGIEDADPNFGGGDSSTICALRDATRIEYVVDRAGGDCPAGCTTHDAQLFASDAAGSVEAGASWDTESGAPPPEWFERVCSR
jgi:hypothetical protein